MTVSTPNTPKVEGSDKAAKVQAKIKSAWSKLSDDDIKLYATSRPQFLAKVKEKQNVSNEDAEKQLHDFEAACGCGSGTDKAGSAKVA
jgi:hypothetical protein